MIILFIFTTFLTLHSFAGPHADKSSTYEKANKRSTSQVFMRKGIWKEDYSNSKLPIKRGIASENAVKKIPWDKKKKSDLE